VVRAAANEAHRIVEAMSMQNFIYFLAVLGWLHLLDFVVDIVKAVWRYSKRALMVRSS
jgi:hypothetical protein